MYLGIGIQNGAVFQRNADNVSAHIIAGTAAHDGDLLLRAFSGSSVVDGFDHTVIGKCCGGKLSGAVNGLPVGGPYTLEFSIAGTAEKLIFKNILVGDIWILAGQSNMAGYGFLPSKSEVSDMVHAFYMDNTWGVAQVPVHDTGRAAAPVHGGNPANPAKSQRGAEPGLPFAVEMYKNTGIPQAVIPCAHGGTTLDQWSPALKKLKGGSLYGAAIERVKMLGGKVAGLLWYQGCSDTGNDEKVALYKEKTSKLFKAFRRDCQYPDMPIVLVQLAGLVVEPRSAEQASFRWLAVRNDQYHLAQSMKNCACVPAIDLELDDHIHLSNNAVVVLGKRLAHAMLNLRGAENFLPQIKVKSVKVGMCKVLATAVFTVEFDNVAGFLTAGSLPCGFAVVDKNKEIVCEITNTSLQGNKVVCRSRVPFLTALANEYDFCYGGALQPHCNIVDGAGRSLPCFVWSVKYVSRKVSQLLRSALVSEAVYGGEELNKFKPLTAEEAAKLKFAPASVGGFFVAVPREAGELNKKSKIYYYKFAADVKESGEYRIMFGADADFALFCDGREVMRKHTSNPVILDEFKEKVYLDAGVHEFCCVFSSNCGNGWGICCRVVSLGKQPPLEFLSTDKLV